MSSSQFNLLITVQAVSLVVLAGRLVVDVLRYQADRRKDKEK